jgi:inward rectifier potassium channel
MSKRKIFKQDEYRELGFGHNVIEMNQRLMNKDGSSNVVRRGLPLGESVNIYHWLIRMSWRKFIILVFLSYLLVNLAFAILYYIADPMNVHGMEYSNELEKFMEIFFFSAQSLTTVGYGRLNPTGLFDSSLAAIESIVGLLGFALATGLLYGRFSRPVADVLFSKNALIAPYKGFTAFMIRVANKKRSELLDPEASIVLSYVVDENESKVRKFNNLKLELTRVTLLTMSWTIVHPIDEESPLYGWTEEDYRKNEVEFMVLLRAYEETFAQTVHTRSSYRFHEIKFGAKFDSVIIPGRNGSVIIELNRLNDHTTVPLHEELVSKSSAKG